MADTELFSLGTWIAFYSIALIAGVTQGAFGFGYPAIATPTLVLGGDRDTLTPLDTLVRPLYEALATPVQPRHAGIAGQRRGEPRQLDLPGHQALHHRLPARLG